MSWPFGGNWHLRTSQDDIPVMMAALARAANERRAVVGEPLVSFPCADGVLRQYPDGANLIGMTINGPQMFLFLQLLDLSNATKYPGGATSGELYGGWCSFVDPTLPYLSSVTFGLGGVGAINGVGSSILEPLGHYGLECFRRYFDSAIKVRWCPKANMHGNWDNNPAFSKHGVASYAPAPVDWQTQYDDALASPNSLMPQSEILYWNGLGGDVWTHPGQTPIWWDTEECAGTIEWGALVCIRDTTYGSEYGWGTGVTLSPIGINVAGLSFETRSSFDGVTRYDHVSQVASWATPGTVTTTTMEVLWPSTVPFGGNDTIYGSITFSPRDVTTFSFPVLSNVCCFVTDISSLLTDQA